MHDDIIEYNNYTVELLLRHMYILCSVYTTNITITEQMSECQVIIVNSFSNQLFNVSGRVYELGGKKGSISWLSRFPDNKRAVAAVPIYTLT